MDALARIAISKVEELEQEVEALKNEKLEAVDYQVMSDVICNKDREIDTINKLLLVVQTERNTLSQAIRIIASQGKIDPAKETSELEMLREMNDDQAV